MEQLLVAWTKKEFFYNGFLAMSSNFSRQTLGDCLCTPDALHNRNSIRYFLSKCVIPAVHVKLAGTLRGKPFQANN